MITLSRAYRKTDPEKALEKGRAALLVLKKHPDKALEREGWISLAQKPE